jgi:hypothetical protein
MEEKRENLLKEMGLVDLSVFNSNMFKVMDELLYTASETGIIEVRPSKEGFETLLKLLVLAEQYQYRPNGIPNELRM